MVQHRPTDTTKVCRTIVHSINQSILFAHMSINIDNSTFKILFWNRTIRQKALNVILQ